MSLSVTNRGINKDILRNGICGSFKQGSTVRPTVFILNNGTHLLTIPVLKLNHFILLPVNVCTNC